MIRGFLESFRYANHLWPILILRLYIGYYFLTDAIFKKTSGYLSDPQLSARIDDFLFQHDAANWINSFYTGWVQPQWKWFSFFETNMIWAIGFLFIIGFLNRPVAILTLIYLFFVRFIYPVDHGAFLNLLSMSVLCLFMFGSGRIGGVDYLFYRSRRGFLW